MAAALVVADGVNMGTRFQAAKGLDPREQARFGRRYGASLIFRIMRTLRK
jgi:hypothetical protein